MARRLCPSDGKRGFDEWSETTSGFQRFDFVEEGVEGMALERGRKMEEDIADD